MEQSALFHADEVTTPLLLVHGASDTNVPVGESDQMFVALKMLGKEVEYVQIEGQDHWIVDHDQRIVWNDTILAFFARHLKDRPAWWDALYPTPEHWSGSAAVSGRPVQVVGVVETGPGRRRHPHRAGGRQVEPGSFIRGELTHGSIAVATAGQRCGDEAPEPEQQQGGQPRTVGHGTSSALPKEGIAPEPCHRTADRQPVRSWSQPGMIASLARRQRSLSVRHGRSSSVPTGTAPIMPLVASTRSAAGSSSGCTGAVATV